MYIASPVVIRSGSHTIEMNYPLRLRYLPYSQIKQYLILGGHVRGVAFSGEGYISFWPALQANTSMLHSTATRKGKSIAYLPFTSLTLCMTSLFVPLCTHKFWRLLSFTLTLCWCCYKFIHWGEIYSITWQIRSTLLSLNLKWPWWGNHFLDNGTMKSNATCSLSYTQCLKSLKKF